MVRGGLDASMGRLGTVDASMPRYAERAREAGDSAWVVNADTTSHFAMLEPRHPAFAVVLRAVRDVFAAMRTAGTSPRRP
jgi:hypothetical protein